MPRQRMQCAMSGNEDWGIQGPERVSKLPRATQAGRVKPGLKPDPPTPVTGREPTTATPEPGCSWGQDQAPPPAETLTRCPLPPSPPPPAWNPQRSDASSR